ncbi:DNA integrity scanning diadenylate cyclase DisA [Bacillus sp. B15-48]|uniref:DNA integrity scanning diadenylate cyclase DisA n=1 Tax=Bacillus sp. B15-48 TaxID=1548601 RepID=UPI00193FD134|nr:DNA integrity scanning diadenylate cyclase DisA [Bacillus sp. B15-48]MBM4764968.1 DNA integrity scanning protein DisA [Bacillus sp. B15-48]
MENNRTEDKSLGDILQFIAPGTPLREGIDNVLRAGTGGLIVVGYNERVQKLVDGGFEIDCRFSSSSLYELAKMDGAIILNETGSRILLANAQLVPDPSIPSSETGMRHRTAERVAKQSKTLVVAISQRRTVITLYQGNLKYSLKDISVILTKANLAIQTLEKYKIVLEQSINNLGLLEYEELVTYNDLLQVLHRFEMVLRIKNELLAYLSELGVEGRLIRLQMKELITGMEKEGVHLIKDYLYDKEINAEDVLVRFQELAKSSAVEDTIILKLLGFHGYVHLEEAIYPRGYRLLNKIPRLPPIIIENLIKQFGKFSAINAATVSELDEVEGIGGIRAKKIKAGLKRIFDQLISDRRM